MSSTEPPIFINKGPMTLTEACNHQKMMDTYWPNQARNMRWYDVKTGGQVSIGYT
jgi:hypothetical protein